MELNNSRSCCDVLLCTKLKIESDCQRREEERIERQHFYDVAESSSGSELTEKRFGDFSSSLFALSTAPPDPLDRQINLSFNSMILIELLAAFRIPLDVTYFIALRHSKLATLPSSFPGSEGRRPNTIVEAFKYGSLGNCVKEPSSRRVETLPFYRPGSPMDTFNGGTQKSCQKHFPAR